MYRDRVCSLCYSLIPQKSDNDEHYGSCPKCKRTCAFVLADEELRRIEKANKDRANEELRKEQEKLLLEEYGVIKISDSGKPKINCVGLAKLLINETDFHFITIEEVSGKQVIYYYDDGYYHIGGENRIRSLVDYYLDEMSTVHRKNEVIDYIKNNKYMKRWQMEAPVNLINLINGVYNIEKDELIPHSHIYHFLNQLPVVYKKGVDCPKIKKFFKEVLFPNQLDAMQEMFGFCPYRKYLYHKAFILYGGGANGKSTCLNLLMRFLGQDNYSTRPLEHLIEDRFAKGDLYGKFANICGEIGSRLIKDSSSFKILTGGDTAVTGEKKFHDSFSFSNYAKLIFNSNSIPGTWDHTDGYYRRWLIFVFPEIFEADDPKTNPNIGDELETEDEISGLFNWAMEGLRRLIEKKHFSYDDKGDIAGERYETLAHPDRLFITEFLEFSYSCELPRDEVYDKYEKWARKRMFPVLSKNSFTRSMKYNVALKEKVPGKKDKVIDCCGIKDTRRGGDKIKIYTNVKWKEEPESILVSTLDIGGEEDDDKAICS